jgi:hypothetical protein
MSSNKIYGPFRTLSNVDTIYPLRLREDIYIRGTYNFKELEKL